MTRRRLARQAGKDPDRNTMTHRRANKAEENQDGSHDKHVGEAGQARAGREGADSSQYLLRVSCSA